MAQPAPDQGPNDNVWDRPRVEAPSVWSRAGSLVRANARRLIWAAVVVAAGLAAYFYVASPLRVRYAVVKTITTAETLGASGKVEGERVARLGLDIPGVVSRIYVKEGDTVPAGALMMSLAKSELDAKVRSARDAVTSALAGLAPTVRLWQPESPAPDTTAPRAGKELRETLANMTTSITRAPPLALMSQDTITYEELAAGLAAFAAESGGDLQRHVVAPAMLDMIGPVSGKDVLDLYCGAGYLSRRLATMGANVTAVDSSDRLIGIAGEVDKREEHQIRYAVAEPTDLSVIEDSIFDDIVCNMGLMVTRDLAGTSAELARLVKLGGRFIFSVLHPCYSMPDACWVADEDGKLLYKAVDNYFGESWHLAETGPGVRGERVKVKHRTLATYVNALSARGFNVRRLAEPRPSPEIVAVKPQLEVFARLPAVLIVEAIFPYF